MSSKFVKHMWKIVIWGWNFDLKQPLGSQGCDSASISDPYWKLAAADSHKADIVMRLLGHWQLWLKLAL